MSKIRSLASFSEDNRLHVEVLRSRDPDARSQMLDELIGRLDDDLTDELLRLLRHSRELDFRLELIEHLGFELDAAFYARADEEDDDDERRRLSPAAYARIEENLRMFYRDERENPRLRRKALEAAVLAPLTWQEEAVRECWARTESEWQACALYCMGQLDPVDFTDEIEHGLSSPNDDLRAQAIIAADSRDLVAFGSVIAKIAEDPGSELEVRICAIEALPNLRPPGARALLEKLRRASEPICQFAADALFNLEQNERAAARLAAESETLPGFAGGPMRPFGIVPGSRFL